MMVYENSKLNILSVIFNENFLSFFKSIKLKIFYFLETILEILQWSSMVTACCLVFSVQLGIQSLPYLLSGGKLQWKPLNVITDNVIVRLI